MAHVHVTLNSRTYRLECDEGAQPRFQDIAEYVEFTVDSLVEEFGQIGQDRLLMLAALRLADELFDAQGNSTDKDEAANAELDQANSS